MAPEKNRRLRILIIALCGVFAVSAGVYAFVHDGKSFAIEAALPQLDLKENPFILREAWWSGALAAGETKIIQHQLFKRNEYWFWLGSAVEGAEVSVHIYDSEGKLADAEAWQKNHVAGVRVVPNASGVYYVRVAMEKSPAGRADWAMVYGYR